MKRFALWALVLAGGLAAQTIEPAEKTSAAGQLKDAGKYDIFKSKDGKQQPGWIFARDPSVSRVNGEIKLMTAHPRPTTMQVANRFDELYKLDVEVGKSSGKPVFLEVYAPKDVKSGDVDEFLMTIQKTKLTEWSQDAGMQLQKCSEKKQCVQTCGNPERCCRWECK